jgi:translocation and assembly module TamB
MPTLYGPIMNPSLGIESFPAKPQEEVLSILLFGKDSAKINTLQAVQLANSLKKISTKKYSGFDPLRQIRDLFGLDDISINNAQERSSSPSIGVEKYVMDNIRIKMDHGKNIQDGKAGVEVNLTPNISIESGASLSGNNGLGLNWKYNY